MDVLLYCLELNEMPDHPSLTAADSQDSPKSTANDKRRLSQSAETLSGAKSPDSSPTHDAEAKTETRGVLTRSVTVDGIEGPQKSDRPKVSSKTVVPPPAPQQRYHPYEEITLTSVSFKNPSAKPSVSKKPSTGPKPTPAPRKSSVIKHPQPVITDLWRARRYNSTSFNFIKIRFFPDSNRAHFLTGVACVLVYYFLLCGGFYAWPDWVGNPRSERANSCFCCALSRPPCRISTVTQRT